MSDINTLPAPPWAGHSEETVRAAMIAVVDPEFNTDEGDFLYDMMTPAAMEVVQVYDQLTIALGLCFVQTSSGEFLDALAEQLGNGIVRLDGETDDQFSARLLVRLSAPPGGGNVADYRSWALSVDDVGFATADGNWAGPGTVRVLIATEDRDVPDAPMLTAVEDYIATKSPVGATVTVAAITVFDVDIEGEVTLAIGVTLDAGMTAEINEAIAGYFNTLQPGDDVFFFELASDIVDVPGVTNLITLELDGVAASTAISPTQLAAVGTVTLTAT